VHSTSPNKLEMATPKMRGRHAETLESNQPAPRLPEERIDSPQYDPPNLRVC
jgi:hypothetical protein